MTKIVVSSDWWTSKQVRPAELSDAWEEVLSDCYLGWRLTDRVAPDFHARARQRKLGDIRLVQCECDPCSGQRGLEQINKCGGTQIGIHIIVKGLERFHFGDESILVGPGSIVIWNSSKPSKFQVEESLHKSTLMIPIGLVEYRLLSGIRIQGGVMDGKSGIGALLFSMIRELTDQFSTLSDVDAYSAKWSVVELVATAIAGLSDNHHQTLASYHLGRVRNYILRNLRDEDLSVDKIASANQISVRYLHKLFSSMDLTVSRWIMKQRLECSRESLLITPDVRSVVKKVAFQWGFNDTAHFSRVFKQQFGQSPTDYWVSTHNREGGFKAEAQQRSVRGGVRKGQCDSEYRLRLFGHSFAPQAAFRTA